MILEVQVMTTIYVNPDKKQDQIVKLSDGSYGVMKAKKEKAGIAYQFNFTGHQHPGFVITHAPVNGDVENIDSIDGKQSFKIAWRS
ncbi:hypothetical protein [Lentilactobacillus hilgardii]|uniref:hypothetical protein n=1 Tax=Lentilactobacillus hilgardii TaxID=1588 RepID=UPI0029056BEA|nr:hypothetical protein [Lentilactobacillus hilgardii]MCP9333783.1 hypothetical protein [Lentilactobacillus hilgardii]MCP9350362.1 hypothetical protein [Lentilactobacillus hilgardii]MCP9353260.1 hypothetical protein [Lentilactobacillus hilgardii]